MTIEDFTKATEEIENYYQKSIPDEQKKVWFQELRNMDIKRFRYIISQLYRNCKFLPKLADIIEINSNLGYSQIKKEQLENIKCNKCKGTGYIVYTKIKKNGDKNILYEYMAVCSCGKQRQYKGWEISDESHRDNYYMPYAKELGLQ